MWNSLRGGGGGGDKILKKKKQKHSFFGVNPYSSGVDSCFMEVFKSLCNIMEFSKGKKKR